MTDRRRYLLALGAVLVIAFVVRMLVAIAMPNMLWPDEVFQSLEQGHRFAFGYGVTPWEFRTGARSWMLPGLLGLVMKATAWVSNSAAAYLAACAGVLSLMSLAPVWASFRLAFREAGLRGALVAGLFASLWFELIYFAPKALSEAVGGNLLAFGTVLALLIRDGDETPTRGKVIAVSAALTMSCMLRMQLAVAAFVIFVIVVRKLARPLQLAAVITGAVVFLGAGLVDWITWDYPFQSYIENLKFNVIEGKGATYGIAPWYAYFEVYGRIWGFWLVPILGLAVVGGRRAPLVALAALLVLVAHVPMAHKEYRFAYPAMVLVVILAGLGAARLLGKLAERREARTVNIAAFGLVAVWFAASAAGAAGFHGDKTQLASVWNYEQDNWARRRGGLLALQRAGENEAVCGVALAGVGWGDTGGYTYLHRRIPIFPFYRKDVLWKWLPHFNVMITNPRQPATIGPFTRAECWADACLYERPGECVPVEFNINTVIERYDNRPIEDVAAPDVPVY
ncbi:MAG: hypothetical protein SFX73_31335 [Kofleriaceae bacterium]|nr:hypothetical protein [Kofleriaceae bacterium]